MGDAEDAGAIFYAKDLSRFTIHIHLLDPDVDRSMAEFEECRLEWSWILNRDIRRWGSRF